LLSSSFCLAPLLHLVTSLQSDTGLATSTDSVQATRQRSRTKLRTIGKASTCVRTAIVRGQVPAARSRHRKSLRSREHVQWCTSYTPYSRSSMSGSTRDQAGNVQAQVASKTVVRVVFLALVCDLVRHPLSPMFYVYYQAHSSYSSWPSPCLCREFGYIRLKLLI
jgi:hypothetical protein